MNNQNIEMVVATLVSALKNISQSNDCTYYDDIKGRPIPCPCPRCTAQYALAATENWRYIGAKSSRLSDNPREAKVIQAWSKFMDDKKLSLILDQENTIPSPRDWFVATSIIQWLTTNVGTEILEAAGWKYQQYEHDRKWIDAKREAHQDHKTTSQCAICHNVDRERCGHWVGKL